MPINIWICNTSTDFWHWSRVSVNIFLKGGSKSFKKDLFIHNKLKFLFSNIFYYFLIPLITFSTEFLPINELNFLYVSAGRRLVLPFFFFSNRLGTQQSLKCFTCNQKFPAKSVVTMEMIEISAETFHIWSIL